MDRGANRVFVNPNFKGILVQQNTPSSVKMHINPAFSHQPPQTVSNYKPKIFINPNFVKPKVDSSQNSCQVENVTCHINRKFVSSVTYSQGSNVGLSHTARHEQSHSQPKPLNTHTVTTMNNAPVVTAPTISKSRYNIVRAIQKPITSSSATSLNHCNEQQTNTIKLSRYKSVHVDNLKKNISSPCTSKSTIPPFRSSLANSKYKFVKGSVNTARTDLKLHSKYKLSRRSIDVSKVRHVPSRKPVTKRRHLQAPSALKINNIPCPLYRKYGKCLRRDRNHSCQFLHDRKHVAICRKFLRGMCFDGSCLLSHELTSKKMPTCHFYLQGMCAKDNCPYLHVKLSDSAKICPDFLKGYCEKGDACLNRHVHPKKVKTSAKKINTSVSVNKSRTQTKRIVAKPPEPTVESVEGTVDAPKDSRYYRENVDTSDECVIKPTRVKLGTLPSYIKL